jgi:hypothetical protein
MLRRLTTATAALLVLAGCTKDKEAQRADVSSLEPFSRYFELDHTVRLSTPDDFAIVRLSGIDVSPSGNIVATDISDGSALVFDKDGRFLKLLGRRGFGPGEFQNPHSPRFGPDGRIHVADMRRRNIAVFDANGRYERDISLKEFAVISSVEVRSDNTYLVAGLRVPGDPHVLFELGADGSILRSLLPVGEYRPAGTPPSPMWSQVRRPSFAIRQGRLIAVLSSADSVWEQSLDHSRFTAAHVPISGYEPPRLPPVGRMDLAQVREWGKSFTTVADVLSADNTIIIPVVRGVLYDLDPATIVYGSRSGTWRTLRDGPVMLRAASKLYVASSDPMADSIELAFYRVRE